MTAADFFYHSSSFLFKTESEQCFLTKWEHKTKEKQWSFHLLPFKFTKQDNTELWNQELSQQLYTLFQCWRPCRSFRLFLSSSKYACLFSWSNKLGKKRTLERIRNNRIYATKQLSLKCCSINNRELSNHDDDEDNVD